MGKTARAWLTLLRPQNFLTVPGDVLAGFFLAAGSGAVLRVGLIPAILAGILFYASGLLLNDWADESVDRIERPERPVPAGLVSGRAVLLAAGGALAGAVLLAFVAGRVAGLVGLLLAVSVAGYNLLTKNLPVIGAVNMGFCRGLNLLVGAVLVSGAEVSALVWWGAGTVTVYIAGVTHLARREMVGRYLDVERWLPVLVLTGSFFVYLPLSRLVEAVSQVGVAVVFGVAVVMAIRLARRLPDRRGVAAVSGMEPVAVPPLIGRLISLLLPIQAAFVVGGGDGGLNLAVGVLLFGLLPLRRWLGRFFYSS